MASTRPLRRLQPVAPIPAAGTLRPARLLALQAFEVAARAGSFTSAAQTLGLTPSAVSHRIRALEAELGRPLFKRAHREVALTDEGRTIAAATGRAFADLARIGSDGAGCGRRLRIKVTPHFSAAWLIPRLSTFVKAHAQIELELESSNRTVDFEIEPFDAAICAGDGTFPGLAADHLAEIAAVPIASPRLVRELNLRRPRDLERAMLIHVTSYPAAWSLWFKHVGEPRIEPAGTIAVDSFASAVQAAERGLGVALGLSSFVDERERCGGICRPIPQTCPAGSYWLVYPPPARHGRPLQAFRRWLLAALHGERS
jgi:DNA-binding transcriptional LysR family regulator